MRNEKMRVNEMEWSCMDICHPPYYIAHGILHPNDYLYGDFPLSYNVSCTPLY